MSKIITVVLNNLKKLSKSKKEILFLIGFPLIFTFIFGKAFGAGATTGVPVVISDLDQSVFSTALVNQLKENKSIEVSIKSSDEAVNSVKEKNSELAIIIPSGFGQDIRSNQKTQLKTVNIPNSNSAVALQEILAGVVSRMESNAAAASETVSLLTKQNKLLPDKAEEAWNTAYSEAQSKWSPEPPMTVNYLELSGKDIAKNDYNNMTQASLGFSIAFVMFTLTFGAGAILEERQAGTWGRLLATPTKPYFILAGFLISTFIIGWVQVGILILAGKYLFGVNWGANIPGLIILMNAYLFAITGLGLMLTGFVKTNAQLQAVAPIIMSSFAMIGGAYWPLDIEPQVMQFVAKLLPTGQAMQGLLDIVARGKTLVDIQQPIYILLLMGVIFFAIGLKRVKYE